MQSRRFRLPLLATCLVATCAAATAPAARATDQRPSWECLPAETAVMVRLPHPAAFLEALRTRTKFGAVVLGADRLRNARALAVEAWSVATKETDGLEEVEKQFAALGLEAADLDAAFAGDVGGGLVLRPRGDKLPPLTMVLAWLEPGAEPAERMVAAFHRLLEQQADDEMPPRRVDLEMAGHPVTWVTRPIMAADFGKVDMENLKLEGAIDVQAIQNRLAELAEKHPKVEVGRLHTFLTRIDGRLLVGQTVPTMPAVPGVNIAPQPNGEGAGLTVRVPEGGGETNPDEASGSEEARATFERYLAAHAAGDAAHLADVFQAPGMRDALPGGEPLFEAVMDTAVFFKAATADPEVARRRAAVGIADAGPVAWRLAFDEGRLRQGMFFTLPAPRKGLLRVLEQECDPTDVPSFVTSEAVDFTQISLDLAAAYRTVKEFATAEGGEQAANMFTTAEMQAQGWLGVGLEAMLTNIGSRHWIVTYPREVAAALAAARQNREAGVAGGPSADRVAFVWKLADDAPVIALLPKLAGLAGVQVVEEQGFQGLRLPGGAAAVFVGRDHLVVGMGGDALERTLTAIRNPPVGPASLAESDVPRKARDLVGAAPARLFAVGDASRTGGMFGELRDIVAALTPDDVEEEYRDLLAKGQALLPPVDEMQGMFGVGATIMEVNDAGVAIKSAWEMPAP